LHEACKDGFDVVAIDADADMNLASSIGIINPPNPLTDYQDMIEERREKKEACSSSTPKLMTPSCRDSWL
jgi:CO dehydrogenase maturation factor